MNYNQTTFLVSRLRSCLRRGAFQEADTLLVPLSDTDIADPHAALLLTQLRMRQGEMLKAQAALNAIDEQHASPEQQMIMHLYAAQLLVLSAADFDQAFGMVASARELVSNQPEGDRAEAELLIGRIQLIKQIYLPDSLEVVRSVRQEIKQAAQVLETHGRLDESLSARLTWADDANERSVRLERLDQLAEWAVARQLWCGAGEITLRRAERLLEAGYALPEIHLELDKARGFLNRGESVSGLLDADRLQAHLEIERGNGTVVPMEACLHACLQADYKTGAIFALNALSHQAHDTGNRARAERFLAQALEIATNAGLSLMQDGIILGQLDLLLRAHRFREAIEFGRAAQSWATSMGGASLRLQVATAYSLIGDKASAVKEGREALSAFESLNAEKFFAPVLTFLASCLITLGTEASWNEAEALLSRGGKAAQGRDTESDELAKQEVLVQLNIARYRFSPAQKEDPRLLQEAEERLERMEKAAALLPHRREAAKRLGGCAQMRALIAAVREDEEAGAIAQAKAAEQYAAGGLLMESANARYLIGTQFLNRANRIDLSVEEREASARTAAGQFDAAIDYYREANQLVQVANTLFMTARLFVNVAVARRQRMGVDLGGLESIALDLLQQAEMVLDQIRRDFTPGKYSLDDQAGKQAVAASSRQIYELAVDLRLHGLCDNTEAWRWVQRAKARALVDSMSTVGVPSWVLRRVGRQPEAAQWLRTERDLSARLSGASPEDRLTLRQELEAHWHAMPPAPVLKEYRAVRQGTTWDQPGDLLPMQVGRRRIYVDWFSLNDQLYFLALRPGVAPDIFLVPLRAAAVHDFVDRNLSDAGFRVTLRDAPEILDEMAPLVEPLAWVSQPEDLVVLCPTGPLSGRLPLHALPLHGIPVLERNPVVYGPSLTALRHCLRRKPTRTVSPKQGSFFGDPNEDRAYASELVRRLGERYGAKTSTHGAVTSRRVLAALRQCPLVHFQGHAKHEADVPLDSYLSLAKTKGDSTASRLTARDIAMAEVFSGSLIVLGACESAAQVNRAGDEPVGLIPSLLQAGAGSVVASQWRVRQDAAAAFMETFYEKLFSETGNIFDRAEAVRHAALAVRNNPSSPEWASPYFWAAFTLSGDWRR